MKYSFKEENHASQLEEVNQRLSSQCQVDPTAEQLPGSPSNAETTTAAELTGQSPAIAAIDGAEDMLSVDEMMEQMGADGED